MADQHSRAAVLAYQRQPATGQGLAAGLPLSGVGVRLAAPADHPTAAANMCSATLPCGAPGP